MVNIGPSFLCLYIVEFRKYLDHVTQVVTMEKSLFLHDVEKRIRKIIRGGWLKN